MELCFNSEYVLYFQDSHLVAYIYASNFCHLSGKELIFYKKKIYIFWFILFSYLGKKNNFDSIALCFIFLIL